MRKTANVMGKLHELLEKEGKELKENIELDQYGLKVIIKDGDAEWSDESTLHETYGVYEALEFLENNDLLK